MPSPSATTTDSLSVATRLPAATRLAEAVEGANTLLYHAITGGQDLAPTVRDPIIKARIVSRSKLNAQIGPRRTRRSAQRDTPGSVT